MNLPPMPTHWYQRWIAVIDRLIVLLMLAILLAISWPLCMALWPH